ncbi:hypothetical protein JCM21900_006880 [Sporobolomyces salmonicolor]
MPSEYEGSQTGSGSAAGFRPRQSAYLRISPTSVLQMILYLEPYHVEWMNNSVLERMLFALKDRIPLKLAQEQEKKKGKERTQVDVFRGADYQMAFFFRRTSDKHVVLLKNKSLHYAALSPTSRARPRSPLPPPPPHLPKTKHAPAQPHAGSSASASSNKRPLPRGSDDSGEPLDLSRDPASDEDDLNEEPAAKRRAVEREREWGEEEVVVIKDEPLEEDLGLGAGLEEAGTGYVESTEEGTPLFREEEGDVKEEIDPDVKPRLKVQYQGYSIFGRSLVVIVEPWPPLSEEERARPRLMNTEIRQLSASVAPDAYRRSTTATPFSRAGSTSATPAPPPPRRGRARPLFRSETTPLAESARGTPAPGLPAGPEEGGRHADEDEDEHLRGLREMSQIFANEWELHEEENPEDDAELPSVEEMMDRRRRRRGATEARGNEVEEEDGALAAGDGGGR